jgi:tripartite ATP-independent transporter DctM subunit
VPKLYLAGFCPGFILTVLFSLTVLIACIWKPHWGGNKIETSWEERIRTLPDLLPPLVLLAIVIGSIFYGVATATEAAAVGIVGALAITAWRGRLSLAMLRDVCEATVRTTAMVVAILIGAFFLNVIIQTIGLTQQLSRLITAYQLTPVQVLMAVIALYLILGTFMEELSMMISTIPITTPLMVQAGYDSVWYGILIVLLIQTAMISPPFGINLFVIQGIRGRGKLYRCRKGIGAVRDRAADHDRDDLHLAGHRDVGPADVRIDCTCAKSGLNGVPVNNRKKTGPAFPPILIVQFCQSHGLATPAPVMQITGT